MLAVKSSTTNMKDYPINDHLTCAKKTPSSGSLHCTGGMNQACFGVATGRGAAGTAGGVCTAPLTGAAGGVLNAGGGAAAPAEVRGRSGRSDCG